MDNIADPSIRFDEQGVCNYVHEFHRDYDASIPKDAEIQLEQLVDTIRKKGKGKTYDCLTGISGGVDSSYMVLKAKEWGLRPLVIHFDNGWNTEISVRNINNAIKKTGFDLFTLVVDWNEFKDLQLAYIKAGVVDLEVPTDHAIYATWLKLAKKFSIKYVLNGNNFLTESIMPPTWIYNKTDSVNLLNIHRKFGTVKFNTYPYVKPTDKIFIDYFSSVSIVKPLNLIKYDKIKAIDELSAQFGWENYGGKHYESFYTKFYQAFILPTKFKIDKRKAHLSNLILAGTVNRNEALQELAKPLYNESQLKADTDFFLKKLGIDLNFFNEYLNTPRIEHSEYGSQKFITEVYPALKIFKPIYHAIKSNANG